MSYVYQKPTTWGPAGSTETAFDMPEFAADIAKELGFSVAALAPRVGGFGIDALAAIDLSAGNFVHIRADYNWNKTGKLRATFNCTARREVHYSDVGAMPECQFSFSKPLAMIAKDIRRKVIEPGLIMALAMNKKAAARADRKSALQARIEAMRLTWPHWFIADARDDESSANVRGKGWAGRMNAEGAIYFDRVSTMPADRAAKIIALIEESGL